MLKKGVALDNRFVVPYNPQLLRLYECHTNMEVVRTIKAIKYMYKYMYKGHDVCVVELKLAEGQTPAEAQEALRRNEPKHFQHCRQVTLILHFLTKHALIKHTCKVALHLLCISCRWQTTSIQQICKLHAALKTIYMPSTRHTSLSLDSVKEVAKN